MKRVVVVGGGISGLTTALHLKDRAGEVDGGLEVIVLEASQGPGGNIQTQRVEGFVIERGPNGYLDNVPATPALVRRLGLEEEVQKANESAAKRYLFRNGALHLVPTGPLGFLKSSVLSLPGRLRVFLEPFARPKPAGVDESIFEFASRRIGGEAASVLIDAMVSGVFAGDVHELSLAASFPRMARMEDEHGGLVKAMIARMRSKRAAVQEAEARRARGEDVEDLVRPGGPAGPGGTLTSFRGGLDTLPKALAGALGEVVRLGTPVVAIARTGSPATVGSPSTSDGNLPSGAGPSPETGETVPSGSTGPGAPWAVGLEDGETLSADAVVVAIPSPKAHPLLTRVDGELASAISEIKTAPLAVVALAYPAAGMGGAPEGFGFLVPRNAGPRILGCLWDSSIFPGRAPEGKVLLRAMIGGAHDPEAVSLPEEEMVDQVRSDLRLAMGLDAEPLFTRVCRWGLGIGQYTVGHLERMETIHRRLRELPGLWVAGSSFYGISMNACIEKAGEQAAEILSYLGRDP